MNELINIRYENDTPTVLGRDLHEMLEVETRYADWIKRMFEYGFVENKDYITFSQNREIVGGRSIEHQLTLNMAKEICMIQRSDKGKQCREYFIAIEEQWNSPEAVMSRALKFADRKIESLTKTNTQLLQENEVMKPKSAYYDLVLHGKGLVSTTIIAKDYGKSAKWLNDKLHELGIQYRQSDIWVLYQKYADEGYTQSRTFTMPDIQGEVRNHLHTYWTQKGRLFIYEMLKEKGIVPKSEESKGA